MLLCAALLEFAQHVLSSVLFEILFVCILFGGFGGFIAHWINNEKQSLIRLAAGRKGKDDSNTLHIWFLYPSAVQSAGIGVGGAIAFLFFVIAVGGLTNFANLTEQLRSIAVSVIAGFGARSLLPRMVGHLERQMAQVKDEAEKASHEAREALSKAGDSEQRLKEAESRLREAEGLLKALELHRKLVLAGQNNASAELVEEALHEFENGRRDGPLRPGILINGARVQSRHRSLDTAIATLDALLAGIDGGTLSKDGNYSTVFYNRGCYRWLLFQRDGKPGDQESALRDLEQCLKTAKDPASEVADMRNDEQLKELVNLEEFRTLAAKYTSAKGGEG